MNELLEAALELAGQGLAVFPVQPRGKKPLIRDWPSLATSDPDQIRNWWDQWPSANIGLATGPKSGVIVIDIDVPEGQASLKRLEAELGPLPRSAVVQTGSGGLHIYLAASAEAQIRSSASKLAEKIDVRADGGYVVAPPSVHPNGQSYQWVTDNEAVEV